MNNISAKTKYMVYGLILLAILTLGVMAMPQKSAALSVTTCSNPDCNFTFTSQNEELDFEDSQHNSRVIIGNRVRIGEKVRIGNNWDPVNYSYPAPPPNYAEMSNNDNSQTPPQTQTSTTEIEEENAKVKEQTNENENVSTLAANAIFGGNSLVPSGLIQWVLLAIIVLLIVLIVRKISGATDRYHESPLKHA